MSNPFEQVNTQQKEKQELTRDQMFEKLHDPLFLPKYDQLDQQLTHLNNLKGNNNPEYKKWHQFVCSKEEPIFEFWTQEYIDGFGNYLAKRIKKLKGTENNPITILEIGAGNGKLSYHLKQKLNELVPGRYQVIAADSGKSMIKTIFPVKALPNKQALEKYQPEIVISSWMPPGVDFTKDIRDTKNVVEYILIGEQGGGCCGHNWETWGIKAGVAEDAGGDYVNKLPPYKKDGFKADYDNDQLYNLSLLQLSKMNLLDGHNTSSTVSFKRE